MFHLVYQRSLALYFLMENSTKLSIEYSFMHFYFFPLKYYAKWRSEIMFMQTCTPWIFVYFFYFVKDFKAKTTFKAYPHLSLSSISVLYVLNISLISAVASYKQVYPIWKERADTQLEYYFCYFIEIIFTCIKLILKRNQIYSTKT